MKLKFMNVKFKKKNSSEFSFHIEKREREKSLSQLRNVEFTFMKHHTMKSAVAQLSLTRSTHQ